MDGGSSHCTGGSVHLWGSAPSPTEGITKKDKWLSEEALQITVQIIEMKGKGEKERCNHMNAEFQSGFSK